nr:hypothetical protein [Pseudomonas typographi]
MTSKPDPVYALIDCNSFYASCERVFRPDLVRTPIVVLSRWPATPTAPGRSCAASARCARKCEWPSARACFGQTRHYLGRAGC